MEWGNLLFWIIPFWVASALVVGVVAKRRGRDGINWFMFALVVSPFLAGLLAWVLPRPNHAIGETELQKPHTAPNMRPKHFVPDGMYAGIPYRVTPDSAIDALMPNGFVRFQNMELFLAAAAHKTAA
jgi:hypothetical protein